MKLMLGSQGRPLNEFLRLNAFCRQGPRCYGVAVVFFALITFTGCAPSDSSSQTQERRIDRVFSNAVHDDPIYPFLTLLVEQADGTTLFDGSWSNTDFFSGNEAPTNDDWVRIWSMTKLVTTVLALDLIEEGVIALDDPVSTYLPEIDTMRVARTMGDHSISALLESQFSGEGAQEIRELICPVVTQAQSETMTVRDLLLHTAGFYYANIDVPCLGDRLATMKLPSAKNNEEALRRLSQLPLIQQPGERYFYGLNTTVLGWLLERATGQSLDELVSSRITEPYGISGLAFRPPEGVALPSRFSGADGRLREAYEGELDIFGGEQPPYEPNTRLFLGGEGMVATARGFSHFLRVVFFPDLALFEPLLEAESIAAMTAPQIQNDNPWGFMGYAVWISNGRRADDTFGRAGMISGGGYEGTHYWVDLERRRVGLVMTQIFHPAASGVSLPDRVRAILDGESL